MDNLSPKARALIQEGRAALRATAEDRERIEAALRARLGPDALPPDSSLAQVSSTSGWHVTVAAAVGACAIGAVAFLALQPTASSPAPRALRQPATAAPASREPTDLLPEVPTAAAEGSALMPAAAARDLETRAARPRPTGDRLAREVALLSRATYELRAGRAEAALAALEEHQRRFPSGALSEERQSAMAQALCSLGRVPEGRLELGRLPPRSPAAERARLVCGAAER